MTTRINTFAPTLLGLSLAAGAAHAQDHSTHAMPQPATGQHDHSADQAPRPGATEHDHSRHSPAANPSKTAAGQHPEPTGHADHDEHAHAAHPHGSTLTAGEGTQEPEPHDARSDQPAMDHSDMDHSGMDHSDMDHSGMDHSTMPHDRPPPTGLPVPSPTDADREAAFPDLHVHTAHDQRIVSFVQFNRLEGWSEDGESGQAWEGHAWVGNDHHRLWLRSEGEREGGHTEAADLEVLYGRPIAPWWDLVAGVRHEFQPGGSQTFAAIGVMGLAPYKFEVEATAYLGESGQTAARVEAEYETLITNRLVLQWLAEATLHGRDDEQRGIGSGLGSIEAGMRLRYEFTRRIAPYVGVAWERAYGRTADFRLEDGERVEDTHVVAGIRFWF